MITIKYAVLSLMRFSADYGMFTAGLLHIFARGPAAPASN